MFKPRGRNTDSGLIYKMCGLSQYKGPVRFPISSYPLPLYKNKKQIELINQSLDKQYKPKRGEKHLKLRKRDQNSEDDVVQEIMQKNLK